jgi:hypothetical protein
MQPFNLKRPSLRCLRVFSLLVCTSLLSGCFFLIPGPHGRVDVVPFPFFIPPIIEPTPVFRPAAPDYYYYSPYFYRSYPQPQPRPRH